MKRVVLPVNQTEHKPAMGFRIWRMATVPTMATAHTHPDIEMNWPRNAAIEYVLAGRAFRIGQGELGMFWGGLPHQLRRGENAVDGIWITLPLAWLLQCKLPNEFAARLMRGEPVTVPLDARRIEQWLTDFSSGAQAQRLSLLELQALLGRVALAQPKGAKRLPNLRNKSLRHLSHMERITAYLAVNYREEFDLDFLAADLGLHPKYLMTVFKRATGITVIGYLTRLRLAHAQLLLATTRMKIVDIAFESGFGSLGRFYEAYSKNFGEKPMAYRKRFDDLAMD